MAFLKNRMRYRPEDFKSRSPRRLRAALVAVGECDIDRQQRELVKLCAQVANSRRGESFMRALQHGGSR